MPSPSLDLRQDQLLSQLCAGASRGGCSPLGGHYQAMALMEPGSPPSALPLGCPGERREKGSAPVPLSSTQGQLDWVEVYPGVAEL